MADEPVVQVTAVVPGALAALESAAMTMVWPAVVSASAVLQTAVEPLAVGPTALSWRAPRATRYRDST